MSLQLKTMFLVSDFISLFRCAQHIFANICHNSTEKCPLPQETANDSYAKTLLVLEHEHSQSSKHLRLFKKRDQYYTDQIT